jgi:hypothetical protein
MREAAADFMRYSTPPLDAIHEVRPVAVPAKP